MRALRSSVLMLALLTAGACGRTTEMGDFMPAPSDQTITVTVTNHNLSDVDVFAVRNGQRYRLGTVTTAQSQTFTAPSTIAMDGSVRLQVEPIGGPNGWISPAVLVSPGSNVRLDVLPNLSASSYSVN